MRTKPIENPYESPNHVGAAAIPVRSPWVAFWLAAIGRVGFWFGVFLTLTCSLVSFVPGAECEAFVTAGIVTATGALVPKWRYRIAAIVLCALCFYWAYAGYVRGVKYQELLKERDTVSQTESPHNNFDNPMFCVDSVPELDMTSACWDIVVRTVKSVDSEFRSFCVTFQFASPRAPHDLLAAGIKFGLFEGPGVCVWRGTIDQTMVASRNPNSWYGDATNS